jgi:hypothetical protein
MTHMRRGEIFSTPCIWANSEFLEAPICDGLAKLKMDFTLRRFTDVRNYTN